MIHEIFWYVRLVPPLIYSWFVFDLPLVPARKPPRISPHVGLTGFQLCLWKAGSHLRKVVKKTKVVWALGNLAGEGLGETKEKRQGRGGDASFERSRLKCSQRLSGRQQ